MRKWAALCAALWLFPIVSCGDDDDDAPGGGGAGGEQAQAGAGAGEAQAGAGGSGGDAAPGRPEGGAGADAAAGQGGAESGQSAGGESAGAGGAEGALDSVEITPEGGGRLEVGDLSIEVPAGAVTKATTISARQVELADVAPLPNGWAAVGPAIALRPHGLGFQKPVTITLAHSGASAVSVLRLDDEADTSWASVNDVQAGATTVSFESSTFSVLVPVSQRSCERVSPACGLEEDDDCCAKVLVTGGTFDQGEPDKFSSTVSSFRLDKYEVTTGRFMAFVLAYDAWRKAGNPVNDAGANPNIQFSGWNADWSASLPANGPALEANLNCAVPTWLHGDDRLPINCMNWFEAFAFCAWDGGRLPTESEWEYAAAGGSEDRLYSWGNTILSNLQDDTVAYANYACLADGSQVGLCERTDILKVGSKPLGASLFGALDMSGSMWEWTLDWWAATPTTPKTNYARVLGGTYRTLRGGSWQSDAAALGVAFNDPQMPDFRYHYSGLRCAYNE